MKVAVLSDAHANLPALQSVFAALPAVDRVIFCGDAVGYYAEPNEVCALLRDRGVLAVRGNHDSMVLGELGVPDGAEGLVGIERTRRLLADDHRRWLEGLPEGRDVTEGAWRLTIRHASPWDQTTYLHAGSEALTRVTLDAGQWLLVGHTHRPLLHRAGGGAIVNPGSTGQPRDGGGPSYALLDLDSGDVDFRRASYDVAAYCSRLSALGCDARAIAALAPRPVSNTAS